MPGTASEPPSFILGARERGEDTTTPDNGSSSPKVSPLYSRKLRPAERTREEDGASEARAYEKYQETWTQRAGRDGAGHLLGGGPVPPKDQTSLSGPGPGQHPLLHSNQRR